MKKTKMALNKKLLLSKDTITNLNSDQLGHVVGGAGSVNICAQTDNCPVIKTALCPVIPSVGCVTHKHTWCWVAGGSCQ